MSRIQIMLMTVAGLVLAASCGLVALVRASIAQPRRVSKFVPLHAAGDWHAW